MAKRVIIVHPRNHYVKGEEGYVRQLDELHDLKTPDLEKKFSGFLKKYEGTGRIFVMPSREDDVTKPDLSNLSERINLQKNDLVLSDFNSEKDLQEAKYPDFDKVFEHVVKEANLSKKDELVFGGMSCWDCVEKMALAAHKKGFSASIDSELTNLYHLQLQKELLGNKPKHWIKKIPIDHKELRRDI